jgi:hypothetical protein
MKQKHSDESQSFNHQIDFSAHSRMNDTLKPKKGEWCVSEEMNAVEDDFLYVNMNDNKESFTAYNGS